jgi:endo-1,4-beta-xylanase
MYLAIHVPLNAQEALPETTNESAPKGPTATALFGTPQLDGEIDDVWKTCPAVQVNKMVASESTVAADQMATARVQLLWDDDHLYALFDVTDANVTDRGSEPHQKDSIELFVDELNQKAGAYQDDDVQYRVSSSGELTGGSGFTDDKIKAVAKTTKQGYLVEMAIKLSHAKREDGTKIGLELQVNDNSGDDVRTAAAKWSFDQNDSYLSTSDFGNVVLKKEAEEKDKSEEPEN